MSISVLKPGMLSSFQDLGRNGYQQQGIPAAGAMDTQAHRLANLLAGNAPELATLEITLTGPTLRFEAPACFALSGADLGATLNQAPICGNRPLIARPGDILAFGAGPAQGARAYLAVHGGYALTPVMGSDSTYLRSGFGGHHGRALRKADQIALRSALLSATTLDTLADALWRLRIYLPAAMIRKPQPLLRVLPGINWEEFDAVAQHNFLHAEFQISPQSDRMGYRLDGPALHLRTPRQMLSEAVCFGTVQVPADGQAIILMADRQTTGGYPKIAQIANVDLPALAQATPGQKLGFKLIDLDLAQHLDNQRERACVQLHASLQPLRDLLRPCTGDPA